jgi:YD repeat-containing protein
MRFSEKYGPDPRLWLIFEIFGGMMLARLMICLGAVSVLAVGQAAAATPATVTYTYDSLGRLVKDTQPKNENTYTYDSAGNRTKATTK